MPSPAQDVETQSLEEVCKDLHTRVYKFLGQDTQDPVIKGVQEQTLVALEVIRDAFERYSLEQLCFSYNGGKDCLVLLIVYLVGLYTYLRPTTEASAGCGEDVLRGKVTTEEVKSTTGAATTSTTTTTTQSPPTSNPIPSHPSASNNAPHHTNPRPFPTQLTSIYIQPQHPFPEVTSFVASSSAHYHLDLVASNLPMKEAFTEYLEQHREVEAIFVGTRRTDPHGGKLTFFDMTDRGWPKFMR